MDTDSEMFERLQYSRAGAIGFSLMPTGNVDLPYRIEGSREVIVVDGLRSIEEVACWIDSQEDAEAAAREAFEPTGLLHR